MSQLFLYCHACGETTKHKDYGVCAVCAERRDSHACGRCGGPTDEGACIWCGFSGGTTSGMPTKEARE